MRLRFPPAVIWLAVADLAVTLWHPVATWAADAYVPCEGEKTAWHDGFDRYDFVMDEQPLDNLAPLAKAGIPVLHVCGGFDPALDVCTRVVEKRYKELGGRMTVIVQEGEGHYPLAPKDPKPVVEFIVGVAVMPWTR